MSDSSLILDILRNSRPGYKLLDLFCGGGGAGAGYFRAGFDVVGVDISPQPDYPFRFLQRNAILCEYEFLWGFDAIHASPPCQGYSRGSVGARSAGVQYVDWLRETRALCIASGLPYIIENVVGSPLRGVRLMGHMFGLGVVRERIFESNIDLWVPSERRFKGSVKGGDLLGVYGHHQNLRACQDAMSINWILDYEQLKEAVPPAYTEFLGYQLIRHLELKNQANSKEQPNYEKCDVHEEQPNYEKRLPDEYRYSCERCN